MRRLLSGLGRGRIRLILDVGAIVSSVVMLATLLPSTKLPSIVQIPYYLVVPGYSLLRLSSQQMGNLDSIAVVVATSFGFLVGITSLFQTFFPEGGASQSLVVPLVSLVASTLVLWSRSFRRPAT